MGSGPAPCLKILRELIDYVLCCETEPPHFNACFAAVIFLTPFIAVFANTNAAAQTAVEAAKVAAEIDRVAQICRPSRAT